MDRSKRIIALLLCVFMCTFLCPCALAAESTPTIALSNVTAMPGDSVTIAIDISNNPGIMAMAFCITYDNTALEYTAYSKGYLSSNTVKNHSDKGHISFVNVESSDKATNGTMLSVMFKVKDSASPGKYTITLANSNRDKYGNKLHNSFSNSDQQFIVPTVKSGSVTVLETCENAGHKYGEWNIISEAGCTSTGLKQRTCQRCQTVDEEITPIIHDFESDWTVDKAATPEQDGIMSRHCTKCDEVTDKITFSYEEIGGDNTDDTSSGDASSDTSDNNSSVDNSSNESSSDNVFSDDNLNSSNISSVDTTNSSEPNSAPIKNSVINNTEGAKNPLSEVENLKDYQQSIKPNIQNDTSSNDTQNSDASNEGNPSEQITDSSATGSDSDSNNMTTQDENPSFFSTPTGIAISVLCILIAVGIIALVIILIIRPKNSA